MTVGVWESGERLSQWGKALLPGEILRNLAFLPAAGSCLDLAAVAPQWQKKTAGISCRCLLLPGDAEIEGISADWVVSYGLSRRDTLTLSALGEGRLWVALQRELVTVEGTLLEGQEIPLDNRENLPPLEALFCVGMQLLLGVPPEKVRLERGNTVNLKDSRE